MSDEKEFVSGLFIKPPYENAPDFVKCSISIKRADLGNWLRGKDDEWINLVVKEAKSGKWYAEVDNWKPEKVLASLNFQDDDLEDQIPF
jgi:hypothetical protein